MGTTIDSTCSHAREPCAPDAALANTVLEGLRCKGTSVMTVRASCLVTDALIAAATAKRGIGILHDDDEHFDRITPVLGLESRWIVARGCA